MLALPVLAGSAAYAVASLLGVRKGLDRPLATAKPFYGVLAAAMMVGVAISVSGLIPIRALYWAAVINAVISVPIMIAVMVAATRPKIMGDLVLPKPMARPRLDRDRRNGFGHTGHVRHDALRTVPSSLPSTGFAARR